MSFTHLPQHIAIIMDGNGRWAKSRFLSRVMGHREGVKRIKEIVRYCDEVGVKVLTLFAFSTENWSRPSTEVSFLMQLFFKTLKKEITDLHKHQVQLKFLGNREALDQELQKNLLVAEALTEKNQGLKLRVAVNYGARAELLHAFKALAIEVKAGKLLPEHIDEMKINSNLYTADVPDPDLLIRTSGEARLSNFLLWQLAYAELYFTSTLFPDFNVAALAEALKWYEARERRFGKTSEQLHDQA